MVDFDKPPSLSSSDVLNIDISSSLHDEGYWIALTKVTSYVSYKIVMIDSMLPTLMWLYN